MHAAAEQGNMTAVLQHIQHLEQSNAADYHAFIQHTRQFTNEFRLDELAEWLKRSQS
ncbi:MAG: hypothetical protein H6664_10440 [Ardenticatenaceae bacterium]|nr:hypothetical protein [Ardenticatenaceae bacterium]